MQSSFCLLILLCLTLPALAQEIKIPLSPTEGPYTIADWKKDWPGCEFEDGVEEGRLTRVDHDARHWLRLTYIPGQIGPEKNGIGWRFPVQKRESAELRYTLRFGPNFDWVKGGKLPGFAGGPDNVSGGHPANGKNGFSARLMWRKEGRGEAYVYHKNQPSNYGESFSFPPDFRFPLEKPIGVRMLVTMNQPGQRDGVLKVWITVADEPEKLLVDHAEMEWRSVPDFGVDSIYMDSFFGGGDLSWAPTRSCWVDFSDFSVR